MTSSVFTALFVLDDKTPAQREEGNGGNEEEGRGGGWSNDEGEAGPKRERNFCADSFKGFLLFSNVANSPFSKAQRCSDASLTVVDPKL